MFKSSLFIFSLILVYFKKQFVHIFSDFSLFQKAVELIKLYISLYMFVTITIYFYKEDVKISCANQARVYTSFYISL
jgi:hypothetical protein